MPTSTHTPNAATHSVLAATSSTKPNNDDGVTPVYVLTKRKVSYKLKITSTDNFRMPYSIAVNGNVLASYVNAPAVLDCDSGSISFFATQGDEVCLYLNSDANPSYRVAPVYKIRVGDNDVEVVIREKDGQHSDADTPYLQTPSTPTHIDQYTAPLTGDIWKRISHRYTVQEAEVLLPADTSAEARAAVLSMYAEAGLPTKTLTVDFAAKGELKKLTLTVKFEESGNCQDNILNFKLLRDGLPRTHPAGFAAMLDQARAAGVVNLKVASTWRPMLGSIAHRAGLGLDVGVLDDVVLNRQVLLDPKQESGLNVSAEEKKLYSDWVAEGVKKDKAVVQLKVAQQAVTAAKHLKKPAEDIEAAELVVKKATDVRDAAIGRQSTALKAWRKKMEAEEPEKIHQYRTYLNRCDCIRQIFDPWLMDADTRDNIPADPNVMKTANERLHKNHMHITIHEPRILQ